MCSNPPGAFYNFYLLKNFKHIFGLILKNLRILNFFLKKITHININRCSILHTTLEMFLQRYYIKMYSCIPVYNYLLLVCAYIKIRVHLQKENLL